MKNILCIRRLFSAVLVLYFFCGHILSAFAIDIAQVMNRCKNISNEENICIALDLLKSTKGDYSRQVILGGNETNKPIKIVFKNLSSINPAYGKVDALGMKKGSQIYIYINENNRNAPVIAIAAILAHEALHQDKFNSLAEETYAWTTEAMVWEELVEQYPQYSDSLHSLACRQKTLNLLYKKGGKTSKYIKKIVYSSPNYQNLPETSPGFPIL